MSNPNKGNSRTRDRRKVEGGEGVWRGAAHYSEKKGNSGFRSLHLNIPLTAAGSITACQCGYAFCALEFEMKLLWEVEVEREVVVVT